MCGILALMLADRHSQACPEIYEGLYSLQHRGQDAAGIVTAGNKGRLYQCKGSGMVSDVFTQSQLRQLVGSMGMGHVRYPTAGSCANSEAQPFYVNSPYGIVLGHNGNLINGPELRRFLDTEAHRHVNTGSDSELLLNIFAYELQRMDKYRINENDIFEALRNVYDRVNGGYACVAMIAGFGILGFRDPNGIRPLVIGERDTPQGKDYMLASESVVLTQFGFRNFRDIRPGECVFIRRADRDDILSGQRGPTLFSRQIVPCKRFRPDIFEYVYFARPDSVIDGLSVYQSRLNMGEKLAYNVMKRFGEDYASKIDAVIPVPDSARTSALQLAQTANLSYVEAFIKNRYIGRTFIMPGQQIRRKSVRRKLNVQLQEFYNKNVLIVDDSIVRGTTSREIVQMARESGAKNVYLASCAPMITHPHVYGIDLADCKDLIAYGKTEAEVAESIGADGVIYQNLEDLVASCTTENVSDFELGLFTGEYTTGASMEYLVYLEQMRIANNRARKNSFAEDEEREAPDDISLHNTHSDPSFD
ncbi:amidophosphoribosyltransferase Ade4 [Schizosaccharomyces cryophilus OY26]|uniref:Amidophosphoribosyltransferase n=1 Tax=Schizosaccharomyces cryophilus (strain OY26 / ATCC MYA-4695 / CBS 11777 / NBRC 106824 / NRRL Y48691) TaxID=653667 RepID=S9X7R5_SCHCR|nr:amidophosphoribosyltransferase Ade4 [Schizosaccharomyces cryophilus OY26]EPY53167.1 amidophosphoribosyltransferase Ade4 [Schizosaccharomyces cryophilus OY26]